MRFLVFISIFLSLYGLLHLYAFLKVRTAFGMGKWTSMALVFFMLAMLLSVVAARIMEKHGMAALTHGVAFVAYVWMGLLFLFVSAAILLDLWGLFCNVGRHLFHGLDKWFPTPKALFFTALAVSVLGSMYGYLEAMTIRNEHITIRTHKLPKGKERFRIVQISDVHLGRLVGEKRLNAILKKVAAAEPDILVSTGDLLDGPMDNTPGILELFRRLPTPDGKFAVMGNHEFYVGVDRSVRVTEAAGFRVLRGNGVHVNDVIFVAGVDDAAAERYGLLEGASEARLLARVPKDRFALLLKHRPYVTPTGDRYFDLQLSGHTHGGQIFPFSLIIKMLYPKDAGLLKLKNGAHLYVSRGAGTWGPPIRFFAPPEITVIDLMHGRKAE